MFGNISRMQQKHLNLRASTRGCRSVLFIRSSPSRRLRVNAVLNGYLPHSVSISCIATTSKLISYLFTYPFESCKIYSQMCKTWSHPGELYQGLSTFMLIASIQSFLSYNVFFALLDVMNPHLPKHFAYMYASLLSSFITSFVKVPMTFISRNIIFVKHANGWQALQHILGKLTPDVFKTSWLTTMLSDVPDSFVKFFVNAYIQMNVPFINTFQRSCITGVVTSIVNTPLDFIVTKTMCQPDVHVSKQRTAPTNNATALTLLTACWSGVHYRMMSCMLGNIVFFNIFNTLTALSKL